MDLTRLKEQVDEWLALERPTTREIIDQGRSMARSIRIGRTLFFDKMEVSSEAEYKRHCMRTGEITTHTHIGMNNWENTANALHVLYQAGQTHGFRVDRAGICLDRRMGLPEPLRRKAPSETGPMLETADQWAAVGQAAPIQPHMGDFMIGFPASVANTCQALSAGVTTIGNLSQFFSHEVPGWRDTVATTTETVKAISILAALRQRGTLLHSYLEDGYGALFYDCATVAGWAFMERYIVEELLGAKLSHCIGGLTSDPVKRVGWVLALDRIHENDGLGSMFYGDTISFSNNLTVNSALVSEYLLWDLLAQMKCPTGHAVLPIPLTEGIRIPSVEEIIEVQILGARVHQTAIRLFPHMDFSAAESFAETVVAEGRKVFDRAMDGLLELGVDTRDPLTLLLVLKKMGPATFETHFGAGRRDSTAMRQRQPVIETDMFALSRRSIEQYRSIFNRPENKSMLEGRRLLIASSDVHEHAILILEQLCREVGAQTVYLGAEKNPEDVAEAILAHDIDAVFLSTHNGMALEYGQQLRGELTSRKIDTPVVMGGVLNQKVADKELPVDVARELNQLGFRTHSRLTHQTSRLIEFDTPQIDKQQESI